MSETQALTIDFNDPGALCARKQRYEVSGAGTRGASD
jgi:hypothetical protein